MDVWEELDLNNIICFFDILDCIKNCGKYDSVDDSRGDELDKVIVISYSQGSGHSNIM